MVTERFYSRFPLWILWIGLAAAVSSLSRDLWQFISLGATLEGDGKYLLIGVDCSAFLVVLFAFAIRHRLRSPAVTVSDDAIEHSILFRMFLPPRRVLFSDVVELRSATPRKLYLKLRSGKRFRIDLLEVARTEREAVRIAIERRIAQRGS
jgi:hypothetical protein